MMTAPETDYGLDYWDDGYPDLSVHDIAALIDPQKSAIAVARIMKSVGSTTEQHHSVVAEIIDHITDVVPGMLCDPQSGCVFGTPAIDNPDERGDFYPIGFWKAIRD